MTNTDLHTEVPVGILELSDFEKLFKLHYSALCAYARMFLNDVDAAEDMVQEVFLKMWNSRDSLEIRTNLKSYLFRAVRNSCLNRISHLNIRQEYLNYQEREAREEEGQFSDVAVVSELEERIRQSIEALPIERRRIFVLSRYEGLKYKEIAEQLQISVKTVENQMGKALQFLREKLVDYLPLILLIFKGLFRDGDY